MRFSSIEAEIDYARNSSDPAVYAWHLGRADGMAQKRASMKRDQGLQHATDDYARGYSDGYDNPDGADCTHNWPCRERGGKQVCLGCGRTIA